MKGLKNCKWPGRNQIIERANCTYYLDGAHTVESIEQFVNWHLDMSKNMKSNQHERNVLLFNYTGDRDASNFLRVLSVSLPFNYLNYMQFLI